jgi:hypothetical protein
MIETIPLVVRVSTTEVFQDPQLGHGASLIPKPSHVSRERGNKERLQFQIGNRTFHLQIDKSHIHKDRTSFFFTFNV